MKPVIILIAFLTFIVYVFFFPPMNTNRENFESEIVNNLKSKYKHNKRKALMLKDGFTSNLNNKVTKLVRKYKL